MIVEIIEIVDFELLNQNFEKKWKSILSFGSQYWNIFFLNYLFNQIYNVSIYLLIMTRDFQTCWQLPYWMKTTMMMNQKLMFLWLNRVIPILFPIDLVHRIVDYLLDLKSIIVNVVITWLINSKSSLIKSYLEFWKIT